MKKTVLLQLNAEPGFVAERSDADVDGTIANAQSISARGRPALGMGCGEIIL